MMTNYFDEPASNDYWFVSLEKEEVQAMGYCAPEKLADGTYNLYAIAVKSEHQGKQIGTQMMTYIENELRNRSQRILIVETSGDAQFEFTRQFYLKLDYVHEATIREFWNEGEDKLIFWKKL